MTTTTINQNSTARLNTYSSLIEETENILKQKYSNPNISHVENQIKENTELIQYGLNVVESVTNKDYLLKRLTEIDLRIKELQNITHDNDYILLNDYKRFLNSIKYDGTITTPIKQSHYNVLYLPDNNNYQYIKKKRYVDLSVFQILKVLFSTHKISKKDYKQTIRNINDHKPIRQEIKGLINSYFKTIKSNNNKNNITALTRKNNPSDFVYMGYNGLRYKVMVKQKYSINMFIHSRMNNINKLNELNEKAITEFNKRIVASNTLFDNNEINSTTEAMPISENL